MNRYTVRKSLVKQRMNALRDQARAANSNNKDTKIDNQEPATKGTDTEKPKWTDVGGFILNAALTVFTALLFWVASRQNEIADKSAKAAVEAVKEQRFNDSVMRYRDSSKFVRDSVDQIRNEINNTVAQRSQFKLDSTSMKTQQKSVQSQIISLEETRKRFEIENQPYLQIIDPEVIYSHETNSAIIQYDIANLKEVPVKMVKQKSRTIPSNKQPELAVMKDFREGGTLNLNVYITKELPQGKSGTIPLFSGNSSIARLEMPNMYIYFYTEIEYINLANDQRRIYKYGVKLKHVNSRINTYREVFINENSDL